MADEEEARYAGVDWAREGHAACIVDARGQAVEAFDIKHSAAGLRHLSERLRHHGVARVAIERGDGPLVDALMSSGFEVVVVSTRAVKALRTRYGLAGNKDDRGDAFVLADSLRTDGRRWPSLQADSPATVALRSLVRARTALVANRVGTANQLRAHLDGVFPGATTIFHEIDSAICLSFLERFPTEEKAAWLSEKRLAGWLEATAYSGRRTSAELLARLRTAPAGLRGPAALTQAGITLTLVAVLRTLQQQIDVLERQIKKALAEHPDAFIFQSLPRAGTIRAATLLAEIGDCRARFPSAQQLACLAGAAPSTRASGKLRVVTFRYACDKHLRGALVNFAQDTRHANLWAEALYNKHRQQRKTHPHAVRILARAWTGVIWRCWQDRVAYDPDRHRAFVALASAA
jgi:transposase